MPKINKNTTVEESLDKFNRESTWIGGIPTREIYAHAYVEGVKWCLAKMRTVEGRKVAALYCPENITRWLENKAMDEKIL